MPNVVDVDAHYLDSLEDAIEYMDEDDPWTDMFKRGMEWETKDTSFKFWPNFTEVGYGPGHKRDNLLDGQDEVVDAMDELGIGKIVLISNKLLKLNEIQSDDQRAVRFAKAYTEFLLEEVVDPDLGIYSAIPTVYHEPQTTVDLIDQYGDREGVVGVFSVSDLEPPLGNRHYDELYAAAEQADLPFIVHANGTNIESFPISGFSRSMQTTTLGFAFYNMCQVASIILEGVPEKFPDLDIIFQESGLFWIPFMMYRLDYYYLTQSADAPLLEKKPSDYMKEIWYCTQPMEVTPSETYLEYVIEMLGGPSRLMYASDYPHRDFDKPDVIRNLSFLTDDEKDRILWKNAEEVFGL